MNHKTMTAGLLTVLLCGPAATAYAAAWESPTGDAETDYTAVAEDIEIMQRILQKALQTHLAGRVTWFGAPKKDDTWTTVPGDDRRDTATDDLSAAHLYALGAHHFPRAAASRDFNMRGYYVPGTGVLYTLEFTAQTRQAAETEDEDREQVQDDLWKQIEGEVRGGRRPVTSPKGDFFAEAKTQRYEIDPDDLNSTIEVLIKTVGQYAPRIECLGAEDFVILAAHVEPWNPLDTALQFELGFAYHVTIRLSPAYRVIIKIPVAAIEDYERGKANLETLVNRCDITRYPCRAQGATAGPSLWLGDNPSP